MSRARFTIENKIDAAHIHDWLKKQFMNVNFLEHSEDSWQAKKDFEKVTWNDFEALNQFCEQHLKKSNWKRLKGALRSTKYRQSKKYGSSDQDGLRSVDLNNRAHWILKKIAIHHGITLSETIIKYLEKPFNQLPEED